MNNTVRIILALFLIAVIIIVIFIAIPVDRDRFINPYEGVNWETAGYYHGNFHTHSTYSDGSFDPHVVIDKYHEMGYSILALTDHDSHHAHVRPRALYPWTSLNDIYHEIKDQIHRGDNTFEDRANEEWQNRDPDQLNMLAVSGSEISRTHHIGSYLSDYASGEEDEETVFQDITRHNGISMFFHPGRYDYDPDWYVDFFERHPHLVGMEAYNQLDRYPEDRELWDRILYRRMPEQPVWGFANDDAHGAHQFGANRNIFLIPDITLDNFREAMVNGHLYFYVPEELEGQPQVQITGIESTRNQIRLDIDGVVNEIQWITLDPAADASQTVHYGPEISLSDVPQEANFVRAIILSDDGRTYTQPFGIERTE